MSFALGLSAIFSHDPILKGNSVSMTICKSMFGHVLLGIVGLLSWGCIRSPWFSDLKWKALLYCQYTVRPKNMYLHSTCEIKNQNQQHVCMLALKESSVVINHSPVLTDLQLCCESDLETIRKWCEDNRMVISMMKSQYLLVDRS